MITNRNLFNFLRGTGSLILGSIILLSFSDAISAQATFNLGDVKGHAHGFEFIRANSGDELGFSVSGLGDFNGDGIDDMVMSAPSANDNFGQVYVVFGKIGPWQKSTSVTDLDGTNGFAINGIQEYSSFGTSVAGVGDVNGDGLGDLLIGSAGHDLTDTTLNAGQSYLIFGSNSSFPAQISAGDLDGLNGFFIQGEMDRDISGKEVSRAGDVNNDGLMDFMISSPRADSLGGEEDEYGIIPGEDRGKIYVIYGRSDFGTANGPDTLSLSNIDGTNGFVLLGSQDNLQLGSYPFFDIKSPKTMDAAGDFNGDGFDDLIIGAPSFDVTEFRFNAGRVYLVYGSETGPGGTSAEPSIIDSLGAGVLIFNGENAVDLAATSVAGGVDINKDGFDDVLIGAPGNDAYASDGGEVYIVYGFQYVPNKVINSENIVELSELNSESNSPNGEKIGVLSELSTDNAFGYKLEAKERGGILASKKNPRIVQGYGELGKFTALLLLPDNSYLVYHWERQREYEQMGEEVAEVGDVNGDGRTDIAVSSPCEAEPFLDDENAICSKVTVITDSYDGYIDGGPGENLMSSPVGDNFFTDLSNQIQSLGPELKEFISESQSFTEFNSDENTEKFGSCVLLELSEPASKINISSIVSGDRIYFSIPGSVTNSDSLKPFNALPGQFFSDLPDGNFALIGNPVIDSIQVEALLRSDLATNLSRSVYRLKPGEHGAREWSYSNGIVGNTASGIIPPYEGFFVQAFGGAASLSIDSTFIVQPDSNSIEEESIPHQTLTLNLNSNNVSSTAYVSFMHDTLAADVRDDLDALLFPPFTDTWASLGSITSEGEVYAINAMSPDTSEAISIPLLIEGNTGSGSGTVSFNGTDQFPSGWMFSISDLTLETETFLSDDETVEIDIQQSLFTEPESTPLPKPVTANKDTVRYVLNIYPNGTTSVSNDYEGSSTPARVELYQNYPNPFNPNTQIRFELPQATFVTLKVVNMLGQTVSTLVSEQKQAGVHRINFDARSLSSGVYFYTIEAGHFSQTKKMLLIK